MADTATYPCGHPRTAENSSLSGSHRRLQCKTCDLRRHRDRARRIARERCEARGHARVEYRNARGHACCVTCESDAGRRGRALRS